MIILDEDIVSLRKQKNKSSKSFHTKRHDLQLGDLQLSEENPSEEALQNRENYAKVALILFNLFWMKVFSF